MEKPLLILQTNKQGDICHGNSSVEQGRQVPLLLVGVKHDSQRNPVPLGQAIPTVALTPEKHSCRMQACDPNRAMWEALQGLRAGKVVQRGPDLSHLSRGLKLVLQSHKCELQIGPRMGKSVRTAAQR